MDPETPAASTHTPRTSSSPISFFWSIWEKTPRRTSPIGAALDLRRLAPFTSGKLHRKNDIGVVLFRLDHARFFGIRQAELDFFVLNVLQNINEVGRVESN